jgi:hypothetical protein
VGINVHKPLAPHSQATTEVQRLRTFLSKAGKGGRVRLLEPIDLCMKKSGTPHSPYRHSMPGANTTEVQHPLHFT